MEKAVNYTPEMTQELVSAYQAGTSTADLAEKFGKTVRSIVAKLSREGVYQKKEYKTKSGEAVVKKNELADKLTDMFLLTEAEADSLTKANKSALMKIIMTVNGFNSPDF